LLAILVSLGAHLIVLGLLVPNSPVRRAPPETVFEAEILPPPPERPPTRLRSTPASARRPVRAEPRSPEIVAPSGLANLREPLAPSHDPVPLERGGGSGPSLSLDGCDPRRLASSRERRDCDIKQMAMARLRPPPQVEDDLSQGGRFAPPDPLPYLARPPKKGCKPKTGGGQGMDTQDIPVLGIACVFHF
jgi:hypothetical protein